MKLRKWLLGIGLFVCLCVVAVIAINKRMPAQPVTGGQQTVVQPAQPQPNPITPTPSEPPSRAVPSTNPAPSPTLSARRSKGVVAAAGRTSEVLARVQFMTDPHYTQFILRDVLT